MTCVAQNVQDVCHKLDVVQVWIARSRHEYLTSQRRKTQPSLPFPIPVRNPGSWDGIRECNRGWVDSRTVDLRLGLRLDSSCKNEDLTWTGLL